MKCLCPTCSNEATVRGVCGGCYVIARECVLRGETTWESLVKQGKILEKKKGGKKIAQWFSAASVHDD